MVVSSRHATFFDPEREEIIGSVELPSFEGPSPYLDGAVCVRSDGQVFAVVGDLRGRVHVLDPATNELVQSIPVSIAALDVECCADTALVTDDSVAFRNRGVDPSVTRVDLFTFVELGPEPILEGDAAACTDEPRLGLLADKASESVHFVALDSPATGLVSIAASLGVASPDDVFTDAFHGCTFVVSTQGNVTSIDASYELVETVDFGVPLSVDGGCASDDGRLFIRTEQSVVALDFSADCVLQPTGLEALTPLPLLSGVVGIDGLACATNRVVLASAPDAPSDHGVLILDSNDLGVSTTLSDVSIHEPTSVSVSVLPEPLPTEIPVLGWLGKATLVGLMLRFGCGALRAR